MYCLGTYVVGCNTCDSDLEITMRIGSARASGVRGWAVTLVVLMAIGLATEIVEHPGFWSSYVLDIAGPAWVYILLRGLHRPTQSRALSRNLKPEAALAVVLGLCFLIELSQYLDLYDAHFDPYDLVAYLSGTFPCYAADKWFARQPADAAPPTGSS